jgi:hypothetical protein
MEYPALYVEGESDLHTIRHLLARHDIELDRDLGPVVIRNVKDDRGVLASMRTAARASTNRPVGFVIDANSHILGRWQSVRDHLKDLMLSFPPTPPREGFIGESAETRAPIGVWIMPDNSTDEGRLEHLIRTLVPPKDPLFELADSSTKSAQQRGATFRPQDLIRAHLHCWLAWQREPGLPFGTAIKAHFFRHDSEPAERFVSWFERLYHGFYSRS